MTFYNYVAKLCNVCAHLFRGLCVCLLHGPELEHALLRGPHRLRVDVTLLVPAAESNPVGPHVGFEAFLRGSVIAAQSSYRFYHTPHPPG